MLKKIAFVAATLLIASACYASTKPTLPEGIDWEQDGYAEVKGESWSWPSTYDYQTVCIIPVKMDIGFWIRVEKCNDLVIKLKQVSIHKYQGEVSASIKTNVNINIAIDWVKASGMPTMNKDYAYADPAFLDAPGGTVKVKLGLKDVDLSSLTGGQNCLDVGTVNLKVQPKVIPSSYISGCGQ
jgi:hypothetical protein